MKSIAEKAFLAARKRLRECKVQMHAVVAADELPDDSMKEDYVESEGRALAYNIEQLFDTVVMIHEDLNQANSLAAVVNGFAAFRGKLNEVKFFDNDRDMAYSPAIDYLDARLDLLAPLFEIPPSVAVERRIVWNILEQTGVLMAQQAKPPAREKDVQDALERVLILPFPETIRDPKIGKQTKSYHPDFGIESLKTAIEVKYVGKESDVGKSVGELYEDMRGYADSPVWEQFMGIIYMTSAFTSERRVKAELKKVNTPKNWNVCVVVGPGGTAKSASAKK